MRPSAHEKVRRNPRLKMLRVDRSHQVVRVKSTMHKRTIADNAVQKPCLIACEMYPPLHRLKKRGCTSWFCEFIQTINWMLREACWEEKLTYSHPWGYFLTRAPYQYRPVQAWHLLGKADVLGRSKCSGPGLSGSNAPKVFLFHTSLWLTIRSAVWRQLITRDEGDTHVQWT